MEIRPLKSKMLQSEGEPLRRYHEAIALMRRVKEAWYRDEWSDGELIQNVMSEVDSFVSHEDLESEIFEQAVVPVVKRATGRVIPDLTKLEHVCEWQSRVTGKDA